MAELAIMGGEPEVQENITAEWPQYDQGEAAAVMEVLEIHL